jgi:hypothetical protein
MLRNPPAVRPVPRTSSSNVAVRRRLLDQLGGVVVARFLHRRVVERHDSIGRDEIVTAVGLVLVLDKSDENLINESGMTESTLLGTGIGIMLVGVVIILLSLALRNGSNIVRWLFGIVMMFHVAGGIRGVFALHGEQQLSAAFSTVFGLIILWILFGSERSDEFFAH